MRLIDADALIEAMKKTESEYEKAMTCPSWWSAFNVISEQPTTYDIDKVVKELNQRRIKLLSYAEDYEKTGDFEQAEIYSQIAIEYITAIEIVKQGIRKDISE